MSFFEKRPRRTIMVAEAQDRWTKLIRRFAHPLENSQVIRCPGLAFLDQHLLGKGDCVVALDLTESNVASMLDWVRNRKMGSRKHVYVGLFREWQPANRWVLRCSGLDACFFSLTDVQSLIRLAQRYFRSVPPADESAVDLDSRSLPTLEDFRDSLPTFHRTRNHG